MACVCLNSIQVPGKKKYETAYDLNIMEEKTPIVDLEGKSFRRNLFLEKGTLEKINTHVSNNSFSG
jgi:hypothetical protein